MIMNQPTVIYLSWVPYGIEYLSGFLDSYIRYPASSDHRLVILFNGVKSENDYLPFLQLAEEMLARKVDYLLLGDGQDIDAYFFAANKIDSDLFLFFNTYSRIQADHWLQKYLTIMNDPEVGLVSASGSAQSYYSAVFQKKCRIPGSPFLLTDRIRCLKLYIKAALYWRFLFPPFPNFHVRTNAFMIRRSLFLALHCPVLSSKLQAYRFESGYGSMTRQIKKAGYFIKVVDRSGNAYDIEEIKNIPIFWNGNQELLLVSDNQTRTYQQANEDERKFMNYLAWGEKAGKQNY